MLKFAMLCAMLDGPMQGALPCVPFRTIEQCRAVESALLTQFVGFSTCTVMEIFIPSDSGSAAPETSPVPTAKRPRGAKSA